ILLAGAGPIPGGSTDPDRGGAAVSEVAGRLVLAGGFRPNQVPVATNDSATTAFNTAVTLDPRVNDTDGDGDSLTIQSVSTPAHGTAVIGSGTITYTPTAGYSGADAFTYSLSDGWGGSATGSVTVTVSPQPNVAPVAANDNISLGAGTSITMDPRLNDNDPNGDALTVTSVTTPDHGSVVIAAGGGSITYTPTAAYTGADSFSYTVSDGRGGSASATISVSILSTPFYRPTFRVMKYGMSGATIGSSTFDIPPANERPTALMSTPPGLSFSYEIDMAAADVSSSFIGVASQAWFDAAGQYSTSTPGTAHWYVGYSFSYGGQSGTSATWTASETSISAGAVLGVTYSANTRNVRIYLNGSLVGVLTASPSLAGAQMYPMIGSWVGRVAGTYRATPSGYYAGYVFD
ncbi:MAG: Ig-like domain-containing protein, partial [Phenylobacterium sp.]|uniref:Ig-like domain-containing protein n=1 Tax=Phenylobacterium sp. TaxID=1871053 RepID=UPI003BB652BF